MVDSVGDEDWEGGLRLLNNNAITVASIIATAADRDWPQRQTAGLMSPVLL